MRSSSNTAPLVVTHHGIAVVRDDTLVGGTKSRYAEEFFDGVETVVYASPCEGGAQVALAAAAQRVGKKAVIVCARRRVKHHRTEAAWALGADIVEIPGMAMFSVVSARAREVAARIDGARLAPFGLEAVGAIDAIAAAALQTDEQPDEVWCAASSGVLARGLAKAWPTARRCVVQVGHRVTPESVLGAKILISRFKFHQRGPEAPFPSDRHYDSKAWELCSRHHGDGRVLFWNVIG